MAGYSTSKLATKLSIRPGHVVVLLDPPIGLEIEMPSDVTLRSSMRGHADVVVAFFLEQRRLEDRLVRLAEMIFPNGGLWVCWPKLASKMETDVDADRVRAAAFAIDLVDNKVCAIDEVWTGLRIVWRLEARASRAPGQRPSALS